MDELKSNSQISETFVTRLTGAQFALFNYVAYLLGDTTDARDVLQETNLDLWRKAATYDASKPFLPWARSIAYYQVLTFRKRQSREKLLFDDELFEKVAVQLPEEDEERFARMVTLLSECREQLNAFQQAVVKARYEGQQSLCAIARKHGCSIPAVGMALMRIRALLAGCVRKRLAEEGI